MSNIIDKRNVYIYNVNIEVYKGVWKIKIKMVTEVDLLTNATYIVKDGKIVEVPSPSTGFGRQVISWQKGKPCHGSVEDTLKF